MSEQELAAWAREFDTRLAETDAIIRACEAVVARLAGQLEATTWRR